MKSVICFLPVLAVSGARAETAAPVITPDVIYGHKAGMALTYDVVKPAKPNGAAVLFMVSGGWVSTWAEPEPFIRGAMAGKDQNAFGMLLDRGFTLVLVRHGSSPYFRVPDAVEDVRRAVRHVRMNAPAMGVNPERLGVFGASAGGHLSLMLGTTSDAGDPSSQDPVAKVSDRVAAVVAYVPPTDLENYIGDKRFPALDFPAEKSASVSPLRHVTKDDAPSLLVHGAKDTLVLPSHSEKIVEAFKKEEVATELIVFPDAGHGFTGADEKAASTALTAWFEKYLLTEKPTAAPAPVPAPATSPAGLWETTATLPDGSTRPATLNLKEKDGTWSAIADSEHGERALDRVTWEAGKLVMELKVEHEGQSGLMRVNASETAPGQLTGTWSALDSAGTTVVSGAWQAKKN